MLLDKSGDVYGMLENYCRQLGVYGCGSNEFSWLLVGLKDNPVALPTKIKNYIIFKLYMRERVLLIFGKLFCLDRNSILNPPPEFIKTFKPPPRGIKIFEDKRYGNYHDCCVITQDRE